MNQLRKNIMPLSIILIWCFVILSCANPLGKGTWRPLPFKKWQEDKMTTESAQDSSLTDKKK
jgi:hypothetical protein